MKSLRSIIVALLIVLSFTMFISCSGKDSIKGRYEFSKTTYDYLIDEMLEESGISKGSAEYESSLEIIKASYSYDTLMNSFGGKGFAFEFDGKGTINTVVSGVSVPAANYTVDSDGKIYGDNNSYLGYVKDSIFWCSWYGTDDLLIPLTRVK